MILKYIGKKKRIHYKNEHVDADIVFVSGKEAAVTEKVGQFLMTHCANDFAEILEGEEAVEGAEEMISRSDQRGDEPEPQKPSIACPKCGKEYADIASVRWRYDRHVETCEG